MIKTSQEITAMRAGGKILGSILAKLKNEIQPGLSTEYLNKKAEYMIKQAGCQPAFKGYQIPRHEPFPCSLCVSINEEVVHGLSVPERILDEGDVVGLDLGILYSCNPEFPPKAACPSFGGGLPLDDISGFTSNTKDIPKQVRDDSTVIRDDSLKVYLDSAITVPVGTVSQETEQLIEVTKQALDKGIKQVKQGNTTGDIGHAIEEYVKLYGYGIIRELVGHGVGRDIHEPPQIPNYGKSGAGTLLKAGMTLAIEPMLSLGSWKLDFHPHSWRVTTKDNSLSAHFEHTVLVTEDGYEILTLPE